MRFIALILALCVSSCAISAESPTSDHVVRWEAPEYEENGDRIEKDSLIEYQIYAVKLGAEDEIIEFELLDTVAANAGKKEWRIPPENLPVTIAIKVEGTTGISKFSKAKPYK